MRTLLLVSVAALAAMAETSGPFLPGAVYVTHAATHRAPQSAESGLAPGSLCEINIEGLFQAGLLAEGDPVTLRFRAPGAPDAKDLTVVATRSFGGHVSQYTALVHGDSPAGEAEVLVAAFTARVWIAASNFGIFTRSGAGYDTALGSVQLTNPARAGDWVTLWGTGLGEATQLYVDVAGIAVPPSYAGPAPGQPGVDQVNFRFPEGVPEDCYIPVRVNGGNTVTIPAASAPGPCRHRLGLSAENLAELDRGGRIPVSQTWVHSDVIFKFDAPERYTRYDTVDLDFMLRDASMVQVVTGVREPDEPPSGCTFSAGGGAVGAFIEARPIQAGRPVVTGPGGRRYEMQGEFGHYRISLTDPERNYPLEAIPPSSFVPGEWSVESSGGPDVGEFRAALRIPPALRWLNRAQLGPLSRTRNLTLLWDPAGYTEGERMRAGLSSGAAGISCEAPAAAGSISIPADLIGRLDGSAAPMVNLLLVPAANTPVLYSIPLANGGAIPGMATFSYLEAVTLTWE